MSTPGWYDDPQVLGQSRWWDGRTWTAHTRPANHQPVAPAAYYASPLPDPQRDLAEVLKAGRSARTAMLVMSGMSAVAMLGLAFVLPEYVRVFKTFFQEIQSPSAYGEPVPMLVMPTWVTAMQLLSYLVSAVQLGCRIFEVVWVNRATTFVRRAGHRTQLSPGWAVAGYFVPVVSLWFPYLAVRDILGTATASRQAGWWWAASLSGGLLVLIAMPVAFASPWAATALLVLAAALAAAAPLVLRGIISESAANHAKLVAATR